MKIIRTKEQFRKAIKLSKKGKLIVLDEAGMFLDNSSYLAKLQELVIKSHKDIGWNNRILRKVRKTR